MKNKLIIFFCCIIVISLYILYNYLNKNKIKFYEVEINIEETSDNKAIVCNIDELLDALENDNIEIIEIINDLDLGYNKVNRESKYIESHNTPLTHPILKETGVSNLKIENKENLIIYSKNGSRLLHGNIRIINSNNIKIENIKMSELWEWDEETKAEYDRNDWDYITIQNSSNVLITHCEFSKSYDGITDIKNSQNVTIEYCKVDISNIINDEFFKIQFDELENNIDKYPMYKYLREEIGLSKDKIKELSAYQFKLYLIGPIDYQGHNENIVIHDSMYLGVKTRIPLARNSSVYLYNIYFDASNISPKLVTKEQEKLIKKKYPRFISLNAYGPISIQGSYVVVENSIFKGVKLRRRYTFYRGISIKNLGKIVVKNDKEKNKILKDQLENIVGVKDYEE